MEDDVKLIQLVGSPDIAMYSALKSTATTEGASLIGIRDTNDIGFDSTNVQGVIDEIVIGFLGLLDTKPDKTAVTTTFTTNDGKTVTVTDGVITSVS